MNRGVGENDRVPGPLGQWCWPLADDLIDMQYTYVGINARGFTYQFLGELFRVRHIWSVTWKAVNQVDHMIFPRSVAEVPTRKISIVMITRPIQFSIALSLSMKFLTVRLHIVRNKYYHQCQRKIVANLIRRGLHEDKKWARPYPGHNNMAGHTAIWPEIWPYCELSIREIYLDTYRT